MCDQCLFNSSDRDTDLPPSKKEKISSDNTVSTKEAVSLPSEEEPIIPPPPRRAVRKVKAPPNIPSAYAPVPSSSSGHVRAFPFFFLILCTRVAPKPIVGWL
jgi:hypothetical protein